MYVCVFESALQYSSDILLHYVTKLLIGLVCCWVCEHKDRSTVGF